MPDIIFLIWDNERDMWWQANSQGYTTDIQTAGRYNEAEATRIALESALGGSVMRAVSLVAAPDNWERANG